MKNFTGPSVANVGPLENVGDVVQRDRFPDVHAHQHVARQNALAGGRTVGPNGRNAQPAAVARLVVLAELLGRDRLQFDAEQFPGGLVERLGRVSGASPNVRFSVSGPPARRTASRTCWPGLRSSIAR